MSYYRCQCRWPCAAQARVAFRGQHFTQTGRVTRPFAFEQGDDAGAICGTDVEVVRARLAQGLDEDIDVAQAAGGARQPAEFGTEVAVDLASECTAKRAQQRARMAHRDSEIM